MYDDICAVAGSLDNRHRLQLGRTWWVHFLNSKPHNVKQWRVHVDSDEFRDWLLKHSNSECNAEHHAAWSERIGWTVDMYNNIDTIALLAEWVRL